MPAQIKVSDNSYQESIVTLNGTTLFMTVSYNTRDDRWYFDLVDRDGLDVISGVKILPEQNLSSKYINLHDLLAGDIYCVNLKVDGRDITRDNFGTDKQFQLWYISDEELADIQAEG